MDDVRASDPERDAAIERLRAAAAEGRLTFEEPADRTGMAAKAGTPGELAPLTADPPVPAAATGGEPPEVRKFGDIKRKGGWVAPAECHFRSFFGPVIVDLREA